MGDNNGEGGTEEDGNEGEAGDAGDAEVKEFPPLCRGVDGGFVCGVDGCWGVDCGVGCWGVFGCCMFCC